MKLSAAQAAPVKPAMSRVGRGPGKSSKGGAIPSLANAATIYPRFNPKANKVDTLEDKIGHCIAGGLRGKPPAYESEQMTQLVSYITSPAQGKPLDMGGKSQQLKQIRGDAIGAFVIDLDQKPTARPDN